MKIKIIISQSGDVSTNFDFLFFIQLYVEGLSLNFTTGMELYAWCETGVLCHLIPVVGFEPWTSLSYQENAILLGLPELS